ncbi:MAG: flippase-like domain-containing protein [Dehalococcoidia bacterium]|nr:flippase-like domain-containing protein [Dehalococcoidia bacterium]
MSGHASTQAPRLTPSAGRVLQVGGIGLVVMLGGVFAWANRSEIPAAWDAVRYANLPLFGLAVALTGLWLLNMAAFHRATYRAVGLDIPFHSMAWLTAGSTFVNMVAKSGGMGGIALFIQDANRRGQPRGLVITSYLLAGQLGHLAFALTLLIALVVVWLDGQLTGIDVAASAIFAIYVGVQGVAFAVGIRSRAALRTLHRIPPEARWRVMRAFGRGAANRPEPDDSGADELFEAIHLLINQPRRMIVPAVHALLVEVLGVATIWTVLAMFGEWTSMQAPVVAYALSVLFSIIGVLPAGIGFAEASLGATFTAYGVPGATAAVAVITYRLFEVWVPFAIGGYAAQQLARKKGPA